MNTQGWPWHPSHLPQHRKTWRPSAWCLAAGSAEQEENVPRVTGVGRSHHTGWHSAPRGDSVPSPPMPRAPQGMWGHEEGPAPRYQHGVPKGEQAGDGWQQYVPNLGGLAPGCTPTWGMPAKQTRAPRLGQAPPCPPSHPPPTSGCSAALTCPGENAGTGYPHARHQPRDAANAGCHSWHTGTTGHRAWHPSDTGTCRRGGEDTAQGCMGQGNAVPAYANPAWRWTHRTWLPWLLLLLLLPDLRLLGQ